ncbi:hypothetical protein AYI68_g1641 [Smittium mucronatum]|uniref:Uncharacterized protein n=1 Tax=Smittium mucronatum TaxID=133383 RepID=A0A1R0H4Z4_9FUNG|nr:hypothetical protein AYI68_g1641 [Smittium mucronatum]
MGKSETNYKLKRIIIYLKEHDEFLRNNINEQYSPPSIENEMDDSPEGCVSGASKFVNDDAEVTTNIVCRSPSYRVKYIPFF